MAEKAKKIYAKALTTVAVAAFWILIWYLAAARVGLELLLPSPEHVCSRFFELFSESVFWRTMGSSLLRVTLGILQAVTAGILLGVLTAKSKVASAIFGPPMTVIKSTPVASFAILAALWLGRERLPVFVTLLIVLPIVWSNVETGVKQVDRGLLEMAKVYRVSAAKTIFGIYVPAVTPFFGAAFKTAVGLAWKAGISAEVIVNTPNSVGQKLFESKAYFETVDLFAWTAAVVLLNLILDTVMALVIRRQDREETSDDKD